MGVRCDIVAVRKLETHYEGTFLCWIAFKHSHLCAWWQGGWSSFPFHGFSRVKTHAGRLCVFGDSPCVIEQNGEQNDSHNSENSFHGLIIVSDFLETSGSIKFAILL